MMRTLALWTYSFANACASESSQNFFFFFKCFTLTDNQFYVIWPLF